MDDNDDDEDLSHLYANETKLPVLWFLQLETLFYIFLLLIYSINEHIYLHVLIYWERGRICSYGLRLKLALRLWEMHVHLVNYLCNIYMCCWYFSTDIMLDACVWKKFWKHTLTSDLCNQSFCNTLWPFSRVDVAANLWSNRWKVVECVKFNIFAHRFSWSNWFSFLFFLLAFLVIFRIYIVISNIHKITTTLVGKRD